MGVGKTSLSKKLSKKVGIPFYDLDEIIEKHEISSIKSIFEDSGEVYFRKIEHQLFLKFLQENDNYILSLGGGTPCYANNHLELQKENVISIYLKASIDVLTKKLISSRKKRPLLLNLSEKELQEYISKHLFDRSFYYLQSKHVLNVDEKSKKEIVEEVLKLI